MSHIATIAYMCENENTYMIKGIDIIEKIAPKFKNHRFYIFGNRGDMLSKNENVEYAGFMEHGELLKKLQTFDFYFQPSRSESFGMAVLEAMSLGVTPIVSKRGSLPEIVDDAGIVFEFGEEGALEALADPVKVEKDRLIKRAKDFSYEQRKTEIHKIISDLFE